MASKKYHQLDHHQCKNRPILYKDHGSRLRLSRKSRYQSFQKINFITINMIILSVVISVIEGNVPHSNPPNEDNTFATSGPELDSNSGTIGSDNDSGGSIPSVATYRPRANNPEWNSTGNSEHFDVPTYGSSPVGSHSSTGHPSGDETVTEVKDLRYAVASFDFHHVATPYIISLWIIIVGLAKIGTFSNIFITFSLPFILNFSHRKREREREQRVSLSLEKCLPLSFICERMFFLPNRNDSFCTCNCFEPKGKFFPSQRDRISRMFLPVIFFSLERITERETGRSVISFGRNRKLVLSKNDPFGVPKRGRDRVLVEQTFFHRNQRTRRRRRSEVQRKRGGKGERGEK